MKMFFLILPFVCMTSVGPGPAKKTKPVQKKETKKDYQFPSAFIFSFN